VPSSAPSQPDSGLQRNRGDTPAARGDRLLTKPVDFKQLNMGLMNLYVNRSSG